MLTLCFCYLQVDNNVTRHVQPELKRKDWQVMILHYLGLDHIGHTARPSSPLVTPKLKEMDNIVETIYNAMEEQVNFLKAILHHNYNCAEYLDSMRLFNDYHLKGLTL